MPLNESWLGEYLQRLNYQKTDDNPPQTGQFTVLKKGLAFRKRALFMTQPRIPAVLVTFDENGILSITNQDTKEDLPAFELEPATISNLFGSEWEKRTLVRFEDLPPHLIKAVVAIEDRRFYQHSGIDPKGILRAIINDLLGHKQLQGGSTITQQLVKNFYLSPKRTLRRKVSEAMMALIMERKQTKNQIIEMYLNEIYLGQRGAMSINGVGEASRLFFRKDVQHISVPEAALLAGLIQAPNSYNPYKYPEQARKRRDTVLLAMKNTRALTSEEYEKYVKAKLVVFPYDARINLAPYFGDVVKSQLIDKYKEDQIYTQNLHIFTTLDLDMQRIAEEVLSKGLADIDKLRFKRTKQNVQGCLIAIEPQTGYIRAFVGGRSYSKSQFDRISQASRQPGSVFKPVVYAAAFEKAIQRNSRVFTPASIVVDEPWILHYSNQTWEPKNYDGQYHGTTTLRNALAQSMNVATAKLAMDVGLKDIADLGKKLGFGSVKPYPSLALGAFEVSPWQVATAYTVFANGGVKTELRSVRKVTSADGKTLERSQIGVERVLHPQTAYIITDMMESVILSGTGAPVRRWGFTKPAAGKTGTTDEYRDAWFVGYTPTLLCVVWTGYDDNTPIKMTGAQAALPIWAQFMKKALQSYPSEDFASPQGVVVKMIDPLTGQLATEDCPSAIPEKFVTGTEPTEVCKEHGSHWWNIFG
ncbi:MAG TPA: PBP1A family penicillin-binding protein [Acidobacteriota bacterium]|nr:PBP1A family penicillin-binding protein [Acidobacteriota bacterium]